MKMIKIFTLFFAFFIFSGCDDKSLKESFTILSGSENETLEPIIREFGKREGVEVSFKYNGSLEIMREIESGAQNYDAIWSASSIWINLGDKNSIIKHSKSIMHSPVIFGIKKSVAQKLGFIERDVVIKDIVKAIADKKLSFMMTSATQSNSGATAYLGFLHALSQSSDVLGEDDLKKPQLKKEIRALLSGINRGSGSSGWLKELFLQGDYDAMVNYEALIIETNSELKKANREPLYAVYPKDALGIADSPLGFVNHGDAKKEQFFLKLQEFLLKEDTQQKILNEGRRVGFATLGSSGLKTDKRVFDKDFGLEYEKILSPIKLPAPNVIFEALNMYQSDFKKPSFTVFALDVSGSMQGERLESMKQAMKLLLDQNSAKLHLLQSGSDDVIAIIPFNHKPIDTIATYKKGDIQALSRELIDIINSLNASGGTDIYTPSLAGVKYLASISNIHDFVPAVILMTDGESKDGMNLSRFESEYRALNVDIPVFSIRFGDASDSQLKSIAQITKARVFDAKNDLAKAFRTAKGYN